MRNMPTWMLGAAIVVGALGAGSITAQAAEWGVYMRGSAAYVPPCPGPGFVWVAGYDAGGYWIPGRWVFDRDRDRDRAFDGGWDGDRRGDYGRHFDRDRDRDRDRGWDRDRDRGWHRDRDDFRR